VTASNPLSEIDDQWGSGPAADRPSPPADPSAPPVIETRPAALLRGSARGLEINVHGRASADAIAAAVAARIAEAPGFFRGSNVNVRVDDGPLAPGCLARLDEIATRFELRIVEVGALRPPPPAAEDGVPVANVAAGSAPAPATPEPAQTELPLGPAPVHAPAPSAPAASTPAPVATPPVPIEQIELDLEAEPDMFPTRVVVGPVRSGVILEHAGHLVVFGDVNPGAEVRAEGNIVVLGRLRGTAHAGIGREVAFILALRLEPQQLRLGRQVARASDSDQAGAHPEIAHVAGGIIVVERYQGRLPSSLVASI
jgi:septum site-determining protein MinC